MLPVGLALAGDVSSEVYWQKCVWDCHVAEPLRRNFRLHNAFRQKHIAASFSRRMWAVQQRFSAEPFGTPSLLLPTAEVWYADRWIRRSLCTLRRRRKI